LCRVGLKPEPVRLKAEIRRVPQASHFEVGLHNIGSGDVANQKHNRQILLSPLTIKLAHFL